MPLHTITWGDTISQLFIDLALKKLNAAKNAGITNYASLWNHPINKALRKYWPDGVDTAYEKLPVGYSIWYPDENFEGESNIAPPFTTLRLKINYYKTYDQYIWKNKKWYSKFKETYCVDGNKMDSIKKTWANEKYKTIVANGAKHALMRVDSANIKQVIDKHMRLSVIEDYDTSSAQINDRTYIYAKKFLYFNNKQMDIYVRQRNQIENYIPLTGFKIPLPDKTWKGVKGDNFEIDPMVDGYVYLFEENTKNSYKLHSAYKVLGGKYQKVSLSEQEDHTSEEPLSDHIKVEKFFLKAGSNTLKNFKKFFIYTSPTPLKWEVITTSDKALEKNIQNIGTLLPRSAWLFSEKKPETKKSSARELHKNYHSGKGVYKAIDIQNYPYSLKTESGNKVLYLNVPNIEKEAYRLNEQFKNSEEKVPNWWFRNKKNSELTFLYQMIEYLLHKGKVQPTQINLDKLKEEFPLGQKVGYCMVKEKASQHAEQLINLLESESFQQLATNYSHRSETKLNELLEKSHSRLSNSVHKNVQKYIINQANSPYSIFSTVIKKLAEQGTTLPKEFNIFAANSTPAISIALKPLGDITTNTLNYIENFTAAKINAFIKKNDLNTLNGFVDSFCAIFNLSRKNYVIPDSNYFQWIKSNNVKNPIQAVKFIDAYSEEGKKALKDNINRYALKYKSSQIGTSAAVDSLRSVGKVLTAINTTLAVSSALTKFKSDNMSGKDLAAVIGTTANLLVLGANHWVKIIENSEFLSFFKKFNNHTKLLSKFCGNVSAVAGGVDSMIDMFDMLEDNETTEAWGYALQALGSIIGISSGPVGFLVSIVGLVLTIGNNTEIEELIAKGYFGKNEKPKKLSEDEKKLSEDEKKLSEDEKKLSEDEKKLSEDEWRKRQIESILKWLMTFKTRVDKPIKVYNFDSGWTVNITPRLLSKQATISFEKVAIDGREIISKPLEVDLCKRGHLVKKENEQASDLEHYQKIPNIGSIYCIPICENVNGLETIKKLIISFNFKEKVNSMTGTLKIDMSSDAVTFPKEIRHNYETNLQKTVDFDSDKNVSNLFQF